VTEREMEREMVKVLLEAHSFELTHERFLQR
jgi:hypothetical protein